MSLYYEAAAILANPDKVGGSLKSRLYKKKELKSSPAQIFALITEASKWSLVLKDIIEKCGLLTEEKKLTPILALLLTHDLLLAKSGVAAHSNHVLKLSILRHKARLSAEFTKSRIKYGHASLEAFKQAVNNGQLDEGQGTAKKGPLHPRWVRVNTLKSTLEEQLATTFKQFEKAKDLGIVLKASGTSRLYYEDPNIPNLLALPPKIDLSKSPAYTRGQIIFQDKASCFPAYLLDIAPDDGDAIDGCAAPGNKTTHLAAIVSEQRMPDHDQQVIAFERDKVRTAILQKMVKLAGADTIVTIKGGSDFLAAKLGSEQFANVGAILLDPSCSGTGIVGRDDAIKMHLPDPPVIAKTPNATSKGKKRKRGSDQADTSETTSTLKLDLDDSTPEETLVDGKLSERLTALSVFQLRILTHAMAFPKAHKITYSTCSIHFEENENVVFQALASPVAKERGWRILKKEDQVEGMRKWGRRGVWEDEKLGFDVDEGQKGDVLDACIRCDKGTEDGTMGFFVAGFVRDVDAAATGASQQMIGEEEDEWNGFSDEDAEKEDAVMGEDVIKEVSAVKQKKKKRKRKASNE